MLNLKKLAGKLLALVPKALQPILKAVVGAVAAGVSTALATGTLNYKALLAAAAGAVFVYLFPNTPSPAK